MITYIHTNLFSAKNRENKSEMLENESEATFVTLGLVSVIPH